MGIVISPGTDPGPRRPAAELRRPEVGHAVADPDAAESAHAAFVQERRYLRWLHIAYNGPGIVGPVLPAERTGR